MYATLDVQELLSDEWGRYKEESVDVYMKHAGYQIDHVDKRDEIKPLNLKNMNVDYSKLNRRRGR